MSWISAFIGESVSPKTAVKYWMAVVLCLLPAVALAKGSSQPKEIIVAQSSVPVIEIAYEDNSRSQASTDEEQPVLKVATGEWTPYVSAGYSHFGALARVITEIYAEAGIFVEYAYFPWPRGYQMVQDGLWHATMPYYCSPERKADFYCSDPIVNGQQVFFYRIDKPLVWDKFDDLKGLNIGATLGYYYGESFELYEKKKWINVQRIARDDNNFKVLMRGRIHAFPQDLAVGYSMIRQIFTPEEQKLLTHHPKAIHTSPLHLIFPKNNPESKERLAIFNKGLQRMRVDGRLQRYMDDMQNGAYERGDVH